MSKYICSVCGYTHEGNEAPRRCPICKSPSSQFTLQDDAEKDELESFEHTTNVKENLDDEKTIQENVNNQESGIDISENARNKDSIQKDDCCSEEDVNEILKFGAAKLQAVKWYIEKHNCGLKEAKDVVDAVFEKRSVISTSEDEKENTYSFVNNDNTDNNTGKNSKKSCLIIIGVLVLLFIIGGLLNYTSESKQNDAIADGDSISSVDSVEYDIKSSEYIKEYLEKTINQAVKMDVKHALNKYFTNDFITLYNEVEDCDNRLLETGDIGFWDFDFWTGGQDGELQDVKVLKVKKKSDNNAEAIVQYLIKFGDYDESKFSKEYNLLFESGEWKIDDFDNYKLRFRNYIETSLNQQNEEANELVADTCAVAE